MDQFVRLWISLFVYESVCYHDTEIHYFHKIFTHWKSFLLFWNQRNFLLSRFCFSGKRPVTAHALPTSAGKCLSKKVKSFPNSGKVTDETRNKFSTPFVTLVILRGVWNIKYPPVATVSHHFWLDSDWSSRFGRLCCREGPFPNNPPQNPPTPANMSKFDRKNCGFIERCKCQNSPRLRRTFHGRCKFIPRCRRNFMNIAKTFLHLNNFPYYVWYALTTEI